MEIEEENKVKKEYIRIKKFCKDNKILIFLIILLVLVLLPSINVVGIPKIMKGGVDGEYQFSKFDLFLRWLVGATIYKNLKKEGYSTTLAIMITFTKVVIVRPIYGISMIFVLIFAISGSFVFPFVLFGVLLYYLVRKGLTNKKMKL